MRSAVRNDNVTLVLDFIISHIRPNPSEWVQQSEMMTQPELTGTHLGTGHKSSVNVAAFKRDFNAINVIQDRNIERLKGEALMLCTHICTLYIIM